MNVSLKSVDEQDIELIRQWRNSDLINNVSFSNQHISAEMQKAWFEKISKDSNAMHWIIIADNNPVGYASVKNIDIKNSRCEFASLYIGEPAMLGSGIGAIAEYFLIEYVYNNLNVKKIFCEVLETNPKVIRLHKKFGFDVEGILKNHYKKDRFISVYILALFKENWELKKPILEKILFKKFDNGI
jgi:UDP-4-amino-4,6-dideoxy-N-acetyl-beta-L-altrosamine N-acetyltransferase